MASRSARSRRASGAGFLDNLRASRRPVPFVACLQLPAGGSARARSVPPPPGPGAKSRDSNVLRSEPGLFATPPGGRVPVDADTAKERLRADRAEIKAMLPDS